MSVAAISDQLCPSECSEEAMASIDERPTKRARAEIQILSYRQINLQEFTLKDKGKGKNGHIAYPLLRGEAIRFNLKQGDWLRAPSAST